MPTTILTIPDGVLTVRYKEPYVTAGLNAKLAGIVPRGIHRGMRLSTNAAPLTVTMLADPIANDHVAHYLTTGGSALTIRYTGGNGVLLLPASQTLVLAIYATYSVGSPTRGEVRSYTVTEYDALPANAKAELVVLGTVVTPGSGTIPAASISHARRSWAWSEIGQDAVDWVPLHDDPSFEYLPQVSPLDTTALHWYVSADARASWTVTTTDPAGEQALTLKQEVAAVAAIDLHQNLYMPAQPGQAVRARLAIKNLLVPSGTLKLQAVFLDSSGSTITPADPMTLDLTIIDSTYRAVDQVFIAPTNAATLAYVQLFSSTLQYGTLSVPALRINNFQAWAEPLGQLNNAKGAYRGVSRVFTDHLHLMPSGSGGLPTRADPVLYRSGSNTVALGRFDNVEDGSHIPPTLDVRGALISGEGVSADDTPRLLTSVARGSGAFILIWETLAGSTAGFRAYRGNDGSLSLVYNAAWNVNTVNWDSEDATACRIKLSGAGVLLQKAPFDGSWADAGWLTISNFAGDFTGGTPTTKAIQYMLSMAATGGQAARPRTHYHMLTGAGPYRTCLWEAGDYGTSTFAAARCYAMNPVSQPEAVLEFVLGAHWDPSGPNWVSDATGSSNSAIKLSIDRGEMKAGLHTGGGTFTDSEWVYSSVTSTGTVKAFGAVRFKSFPIPVWEVYGYNVASAAAYLTKDVQVTLTNAVTPFMVGGTVPMYVVLPTCRKVDSSLAPYIIYAYGHTSTTFALRAFDWTVDPGPSQVDMSTDTNDVAYMFTVHSR